MSFTPLPIVSVGLDDLQLDLDNYRIPTHRDDQAAALVYLIASEDVLGAALLILRDGYFDNEVPIVVAGEEGYVVLEGNRRVSALKVMQDPGLVPEREAEVRTLLRRYAVEAEDLPNAIRVLVSPDREVAAPHIARLHTGLSKKRWSRDQQATYYFSLLGPHSTVDDIKSRYPGTSVVRFIKMAMIRRFLEGVTFADRSLHDFVTGPALTMSAFEYAYRHRDIAQAIGVTFDQDGQLLPRSSTPGAIGKALTTKHRKALEYLVEGFRRPKGFSTRSLEFKSGRPEFLSLVDLLTGMRKVAADPENPEWSPADAPEPDEDGDPDEDNAPDENDVNSAPESGNGGAPAESNSESPTGTGETPQEVTGGARGPNHPDTRETLELAGIDFKLVPVGLQLRYQELRRISVKKLPAAAAMLMRSVLETTIKWHFESTTTPATGDLKTCIDVLRTAYVGEKPVRAAIDRIKSGTVSQPGSLPWFNVLVHSADTEVRTPEVQQAWKLINPVLRRLLRPPGVPA